MIDTNQSTFACTSRLLVLERLGRRSSGRRHVAMILLGVLADVLGGRTGWPSGSFPFPFCLDSLDASPKHAIMNGIITSSANKKKYKVSSSGKYVERQQESGWRSGRMEMIVVRRHDDPRTNAGRSEESSCRQQQRRLAESSSRCGGWATRMKPHFLPINN